MSEALIPDHIAQLVRDRRANLWVCQRYDLNSGASTHTNTLTEAEIVGRYRLETDQIDVLLASIYWETIWMEGAASPLIHTIEDGVRLQEDARVRRPILLASEKDAAAKISSDEFLPISILPGRLDPSAPRDSRYGFFTGRVRDRIAWELKKRIQSLPGRLFVVVGAEQPADLENFFETIEDLQIVNLEVLLVTPGQDSLKRIVNKPGVRLYWWDDSLSSLITEFKAQGAPPSGTMPDWTIRVNSQRVVLTPAALRHVEDHFALITESMLHSKSAFNRHDFIDFLSGSLRNWSAYGVGLPVPRAYLTDDGLSLSAQVMRELDQISSPTNEQLVEVIQLPCVPGAGATTLLREAAFKAAKAGYPTLILKPEQIDLDPEEVAAFATAIADEFLYVHPDQSVPAVLLVIDTEHQYLRTIRTLPQVLGTRGIRALILTAIHHLDGKERALRTGKHLRLNPLLAEIDEQEVEACANVFRKLSSDYSLGLEVPTIEHWTAYAKASQIQMPGGLSGCQNTFWILLRFYLSEGEMWQTPSDLSQPLTRWIRHQVDIIDDEDAKTILKNIAFLSTMRLISPLWTVLRAVTGGVFTAGFANTLRGIESLVVWGEFQSELEDQVLWFKHPVLADEFLKLNGLVTLQERLGFAQPMIDQLSSGSMADIWVAESLAFYIVPSYETRREADWEMILNLFDSFPRAIVENSKLILHHWARCLFNSVKIRGITLIQSDLRKLRLNQAVDFLRRALSLPRRPFRDEYPSHIQNSLATILLEFANYYSECESNQEAAHKIWEEAINAFELSISLSEGTNSEALLAYAKAMIDHAKTMTIPAERLSSVSQALAILDQTEELLNSLENPDPSWVSGEKELRSSALGLVDPARQSELISNLRSINPDLSVYLSTHLVIDSNQDDFDKALNILREADADSVRLGVKSLTLWIRLMLKHPVERFNHHEQLRLSERLEGCVDYRHRVFDDFRHTVLCYQTGDFDNGAVRFRDIRQYLYNSDVRFRLSDYLRDLNDPQSHRIVSLKVEHITSPVKATGYVTEIGQEVRFRPRDFPNPPHAGDIISCIIIFHMKGPIAFPPRFGRERSVLKRVDR